MNRQTHGSPLESHPISSPCEPSAQVSLQTTLASFYGMKSGFSFATIFANQIYLYHFLELRARVLLIFIKKESGVWPFFAKKSLLFKGNFLLRIFCIPHFCLSNNQRQAFL